MLLDAFLGVGHLALIIYGGSPLIVLHQCLVLMTEIDGGDHQEHEGYHKNHQGGLYVEPD